MIKKVFYMKLNSAPSSSGLGHRPFTAATRVRISLGSGKQSIIPARGVSCFY